jgi:hypothetical protein
VQTPLLSVASVVLRAVNENVDRRAACVELTAGRTVTSTVNRWYG